jgi:UDP-N-acetylmuramoyl-L-alanyl-D-glutamate--2,6-diaminopimelate ligase
MTIDPELQTGKSETDKLIHQPPYQNGISSFKKMKHLSEIIKYIKPEKVIGFHDNPVTGIKYLAENLEPGNVFACMDEFLKYDQWIEGRSQLPLLGEKKISGLILDTPVSGLEVPQLIVSNPVQSTAAAAKFFYDAPDNQMSIAGVTGTNGKTTICHLTSHLLSSSGTKSASLGTIGMYIDGLKIADAIYTTPLAADLFRTLSGLTDKNVEATVMEISSHSIKLDRVFGLDVDVAVFSNISRDHIDFHKTMDDYVGSKEKLFTRMKPDGTAVINMDDPIGQQFAESAACRVIGYGISESADLEASQIKYDIAGTAFTLTHQGRSIRVKTRLIGAFNVSNALAAAGACIALGIDLESLIKPLASFKGVNGRVEAVKLPGNRIGIVDYSHTPDALEKILETIRETTTDRIITVFGCGGDRDPGKRPMMGSIAEKLSDMCIVTSDNPRTENPETIIEDILKGIKGSDHFIEPDRRQAIKRAYKISMPGDIILVAGKGHETYQILGTERVHFSDKEELLCLSAK